MKRKIKQNFAFSSEEYELDSLGEGEKSSLINESDHESFYENSDSESDISNDDRIEKVGKSKAPPKLKPNSNHNNDELHWADLNFNLEASNIAFKHKKLTKMNKNENNETKRISECFLEFFTMEMIEMITNESNDYAKINKNKFSWAKRIFKNNISTLEMKQYMGIRLSLGITRCAELKDIYSNAFPYNFIKYDKLGKTRFEDIGSSLHFQADIENIQGNNYFNNETNSIEEIHKIGKLLKLFHDRCFMCTKYRLSKELTLDEMMVRFQGRSAMIYHRQPKPTSVGIKIASISDPNGFLVKFLVLGGPGKSMPIHDMVINLATGLTKGHIIYMDNLYCSVKTAISLSKINILCCGTTRKKRGVPHDTILDPANSNQGNFKFRMSEIDSNKRIIAGHWHDSKILGFLSTYHDGEALSMKRRKSGHSDKITIVAPRAMYDYNQFMHGNDRADQMRKSFSIQIRAKKWYKPLFNFIFDSAAINGFLLYRQCYGNQIQRKKYMLLLCKWLCQIDENGNIEKNETNDDDIDININDSIKGLNGVMKGNHCLGYRSNFSDESSSNSNNNNRGYCFVHMSLGMKKRSQLYCHGCNKHFHFKCYQEYHFKKHIFKVGNNIKSE